MPRTRKYTLTDIMQVTKALGLHLLQDYPALTKEKVKCQCEKCGYIFSTKLSHLIEGSRCRKCQINKQKLSYNELKDYFEEQGCVLLSTTYENAYTHLDYQCVCGNITKTLWPNFKKGKRCQKCKGKRLSGRLHHNWNSNREEVVLNNLVLKKACKALQTILSSTGKKKARKSFDMLGYDTRALREHLESHPNWPNVKEQRWHLDHIFPINAFVKNKIFDTRIINALDNLQPLSESENTKKAGSYDHDKFAQWLLTKGITI
jgi:hypothetical protein